MTAAEPTLRRFVIAAFLWLPGCFAAWYWSAAIHTEALGWVARLLLWGLDANLVSGVERIGHELTFVSTVEVATTGGATGMLVGEVNALSYSYGLPLFLALVLASRTPWPKLLLGTAALLPLLASGIAFAFLVQFAAAGAAVAAKAGIVGWRAECVALGYQFGTLILPGLAPLVLWAAANRAFIARATAPRAFARKGTVAKAAQV